jgi:hypothetical protein
MAWIGFGIPGRKSKSTYTKYSYDSLPKITIQKEFAIFNRHETLKKLRNLLKTRDPNTDFLQQSPTGCYFTSCKKLGAPILKDPEDCVTWTLEKNGRVYAQMEDNQEKFCVGSLGEFLTRLTMENALWYKFALTYPSDTVYLLQSQADYLAHFRGCPKRIIEIITEEDGLVEQLGLEEEFDKDEDGDVD